MITLHKFKLSMFEEVVDMYYDFNKEIYTNRKIGEKYFYYKIVTKWINSDCDIIVSLDKDIVTGFSLCYKDDNSGITEAVYQCDVAYVKPEFRKGRSAYMLYKNAKSYASEIGLKVSCNGRIENGVDKMIEKHFGLRPMFTLFEEF